MSPAGWRWVDEELSVNGARWVQLERRDVAGDAVRVGAGGRKKMAARLGAEGDISAVHLLWKSWVVVGESCRKTR